MSENTEAGGLVERLRETHTCDGCGEYVGSQITDLTEEAATALASERAAHAETKRVRDEVYQQYVDANEARIDAEAQLAEADKALEPFAKVAREWDSEIATLHVFLEWNDSAEPVPSLPVADFRAARRVREGGSNG